MCQRVFAVSGQACATVKVTVPQAKATPGPRRRGSRSMSWRIRLKSARMSVTKNVTVKAISTKNAHATAKAVVF